MDDRRFDQLARAAASSRRSVLAGLAAALAAGLLPRLGRGGQALAAKKCEDRDGKPCRTCCDGQICVKRVTFKACGRNGDKCDECKGGVRCDERKGECVCDKESCFGCCETEGQTPSCVKPGQSATPRRCGRDGERCKDCPKILGPGAQCHPRSRKCCLPNRADVSGKCAPNSTSCPLCCGGKTNQAAECCDLVGNVVCTGPVPRGSVGIQECNANKDCARCCSSTGYCDVDGTCFG